MMAMISEPTPDCGQPSSAEITRCVFFTEFTIVSLSIGFSVRKLMTCAGDHAVRHALGTDCIPDTIDTF